MCIIWLHGLAHWKHLFILFAAAPLTCFYLVCFFYPGVLLKHFSYWKIKPLPIRFFTDGTAWWIKTDGTFLVWSPTPLAEKQPDDRASTMFNRCVQTLPVALSADLLRAYWRWFEPSFFHSRRPVVTYFQLSSCIVCLMFFSLFPFIQNGFLTAALPLRQFQKL